MRCCTVKIKPVAWDHAERTIERAVCHILLRRLLEEDEVDDEVVMGESDQQREMMNQVAFVSLELKQRKEGYVGYVA